MRCLFKGTQNKSTSFLQKEIHTNERIVNEYGEPSPANELVKKRNPICMNEPFKGRYPRKSVNPIRLESLILLMDRLEKVTHHSLNEFFKNSDPRRSNELTRFKTKPPLTNESMKARDPEESQWITKLE